MKTLHFVDRCANHDIYTLAIPDRMQHWRFDGLLDYLASTQSESVEDGYLPVPIDPLHFEQFRQLITHPTSTMNAPPVLQHQGTELKQDTRIDLTQPVTVIDIDRLDAHFADFVKETTVAQRNQTAYASCGKRIDHAFNHLLALDRNPLVTEDGTSISSFAELREGFHSRCTPADRLEALWRFVQIVYLAPFENISRILQNRQSRPGYAVWQNISDGHGGICAEKTAAIGFVCDILEIPYSPVLGAVGGLPEDYEKQLLDYAGSGGSTEAPPWAQHHILDIALDGHSYLVDVTNGNIPLVFATGTDRENLLEGGVRARMVYRTEKLKFRPCSTLTGDILHTLSEFHIPELHVQYIFSQGLGLHISNDLFIGVFYDWGGESSALQENHYTSTARKAGFPCPRFIHGENLACLEDLELRPLFTALLAALREQVSETDYSGDFTFVLQPISGSFWKLPRISSSIARNLRSGSDLLTMNPGADMIPTRL